MTMQRTHESSPRSNRRRRIATAVLFLLAAALALPDAAFAQRKKPGPGEKGDSSNSSNSNDGGAASSSSNSGKGDAGKTVQGKPEQSKAGAVKPGAVKGADGGASSNSGAAATTPWSALLAEARTQTHLQESLRVVDAGVSGSMKSFLGIGTPLQRLEALPAAKQQQAAREFVARMRQDPAHGFTVKRGAWQPATPVDAPLARTLNRAEQLAIQGQMNEALTSALPPAQRAAIDAAVTAAADFAANAFADPGEANAYLSQLRDKIKYRDIRADRFVTAVNGGDERVLFSVAAENMTPARLQTELSQLSFTEQAKLFAHCFDPAGPYAGLREGPYRIVTVLPEAAGDMGGIFRDAGRLLMSGFYDADAFARDMDQARGPLQVSAMGLMVQNLERAADAAVAREVTLFNQNRAALAADLNSKGPSPLSDAEFLKQTGMTRRAAQRLLPTLNAPLTAQQGRRFFERFGFRLGIATDGTPIEHTLSLQDPARTQILEQLAALEAGKPPGGESRYVQGLRSMVMAVPTAGKPLAELTFVPSMVRELKSVLADAGEPPAAIARFPLIVFDQSGNPLLASNRQYLTDLSRDTGARIVAVDMAQITALGRALGIEGMFDTTGNGRAGYGGARNITFLLGPMIQEALNTGMAADVNALIALPPAQLRQLLQQTALSNQNRYRVLMGDDDATMMPGFLHAKTLINADQGNAYAASMTFLSGRGTTAGPVVYNLPGVFALGSTPDAARGLAESVMGASTWQAFDMEPMMAAALMAPGACLNLPTPTEEGHFRRYEMVRDHLGRGLHHAGDRYADMPERLRGFLGYSTQGKLASALLQAGMLYRTSDVMPWNSAARDFDSLGALFQFAGQPAQQKGMQKGFFRRLVAFDRDANLNGLLQTDHDALMAPILSNPRLTPEERADLAQVPGIYEAAQNDLSMGVAYRDAVVSELVKQFRALPAADQGTPAWQAADAKISRDPASALDAIGYLIDKGADLGPAVEQARQNPVGDPNATPLAQVVYLMTRAVGAAKFNDLMRAMP